MVRPNQFGDEAFRRIVGQREQAPLGTPPNQEARQRLAQMARYHTGAPKGVFRYASHEQANEDRASWLVAQVLRQASEPT